MNETFWHVVDTYTTSRWWFDMPALVVFGIAAVLWLLAALRLHQRNIFSILIAALAFGGALASLYPGALLAWQPAASLGLQGRDLASLPTSTFASVAQVFDRNLQLGYIGSGLTLIGLVSAIGGLGSRHVQSCPSCSRALHKSWNSVCPECQLMQPHGAEARMMRPGDLSASGVQVTLFDAPAQTALLDSASNDACWVEIVRGSSGVGERFTIGARLTIGRDPNQCRLIVDDEAVSARHAYIEHDHHQLVVYDWGSRNGTVVNDQPVARQILNNNDLIRVGRTVLRFHATITNDEGAATVLMDTLRSSAQLVALNGPIAGQVFPIHKLDVRIGRSHQSDIVLKSPTVSRLHANIRFNGADFSLEDSEASNGTWLDEKRVIGAAKLHFGQIIRLGDQELSFERNEADDVATNQHTSAVHSAA